MTENNTQIEASSHIMAALDKRKIEEPVWLAIRNSVFPGATEESCLMALDYCKARGLDIMKKPCHIVPMSVKDAKSGKYTWRDVIMPGIAESRITASRTKLYAGQDAPVFGPTVKLDFKGQTHSVPEFCTVTVYRVAGDERVPYSHTEYFEEAAGTNKGGDLNTMWTKRKRGQLAKCAEAGALRKAFPEETGGLTTYEEAVDVESYDIPKRGIQKFLRESAVNPFDQPKQIEGGDGKSTGATPDGGSTPPASTKADDVEKKPADLLRGMLSDVAIKKGEKKDGSPWKAWMAHLFINGKEVTAGTFSKTLGERAVKLKGGEVLVDMEATDKGVKLTHIEAAPAENEEGGLL